MDLQSLLISLLGIFAIACAVGSWLTRDNFYSALYMSVAMLFVAGIYASFNLQPAVVLITLVFVGAVGIVTIAVAATYRARIPRKMNLIWTLPALVIIAVLGYVYSEKSISEVNYAVMDFVGEYFLAIIFLICMMVLVMLSAIRILRRVGL
uniref:NADH-quinone oxidoreductase subunit J n=1 Tax=Archaeoglobus fulgidus TaxID=2234 RepID=A0A7J2TJD3_ARCFL